MSFNERHASSNERRMSFNERHTLNDARHKSFNGRHTLNEERRKSLNGRVSSASWGVPARARLHVAPNWGIDRRQSQKAVLATYSI